MWRISYVDMDLVSPAAAQVAAAGEDGDPPEQLEVDEVAERRWKAEQANKVSLLSITYYFLKPVGACRKHDKRRPPPHRLWHANQTVLMHGTTVPQQPPCRSQLYEPCPVAARQFYQTLSFESMQGSSNTNSCQCPPLFTS
jgi:hypothetical protein